MDSHSCLQPWLLWLLKTFSAHEKKKNKGRGKKKRGEEKEQKENCNRSQGNDGLREIIHLVSPGLHNLDVSGYFSLPESPAACGRERSGDAPSTPRENCRDSGLCPHSRVPGGQGDASARSCVPGGGGEDWNVMGSGGASPGRPWQQNVPPLSLFLSPTGPSCPLPLFFPPSGHSPFPPSLPFLSDAARENWCEIKKGLCAQR